jgi:hypothetical protein
MREAILSSQAVASQADGVAHPFVLVKVGPNTQEPCLGELAS